MQNYDFMGAFEEYMRAYQATADDHAPQLETLSGDDLLMKSARALQMAEGWRAQVGTWEKLGNTLGRQLDKTDSTQRAGDTVPEEVTKLQSAILAAYETPGGRELFSQFNVISDLEWALLDKCPDNCSSGCLDRRRQAWAYEWAAETAAATGNLADAARLFRRAGWAWEKALHYGRAGGQAESDVDTPESEKRLERAAACYTRAAANAAQTTRRATRNMIATRPWCPACQRDKTSEKEDECSHSSAIDKAGVPKEDWPATDVERLLRVWQGVAAIRRSQDREHHISGTCAARRARGLRRLVPRCRQRRSPAFQQPIPPLVVQAMSYTRHTSQTLRSPRSPASTISAFCSGVNCRYLRFWLIHPPLGDRATILSQALRRGCQPARSVRVRSARPSSPPARAGRGER